MSRVLRIAAFLIGIAAVVDPVFAVRRTASAAVAFVVPPIGQPDHDEAVVVRNSIARTLPGTAKADSGEVPRALISVGDTRLGGVGDATVFAVPLPAVSRVSAVSAPGIEVMWGQQSIVAPAFRGQRMVGKRTTFRMVSPGGATLTGIQHQWTKEDEIFAPALPYSPITPGLAVLRVVAASEAAPETSVNVTVNARDRRARVLVFEPRPSWAVGFARQSLESDPLFDVRAVARTSRGVVTQTAGTPPSLSAVDPDSVDVLLVGGLDALSDADLSALSTFTADRGGSVLLVPDGRVPEKVRRTFDLPQTLDALLERPVDLQQGGIIVRASEVLRATSDSSPRDAALVVSPRGKGQVMLSMALDAWRYRAEPRSGFDRFWRAVVADAAVASVPRVSARLDSTVVRPGDRVRLVVSVRSLQVTRDGLALPTGSAAIVGTDGKVTPLRLWPGERANEFTSLFSAPAPGQYNVRVVLDGLPGQDAILIVDPAAARAGEDRSRELAFVAQATGGRVVPDDDVAALKTAIEALPGVEETREVRPTRSGWWMVAFVACIGTEWAMRRSRGQR